MVSFRCFGFSTCRLKSLHDHSFAFEVSRRKFCYLTPDADVTVDWQKHDFFPVSSVQ